MNQTKLIAGLLVFSFSFAFNVQTGVVSGQQLSRKQASDIFMGLRKNVGTKQVKGGGLKMLSAVPDAKNLPTFPPTKPGMKPKTAEVGAKMWFVVEGPNGDRFVDPTKRRWRPGDKFLVLVEPAVAMTFSITQHFPNGNSKLVYPVEGLANTYAPIAPGVTTLIPVPFQLDADFNPEDLVFAFARTDSDVLPPAFEEERPSGNGNPGSGLGSGTVPGNRPGNGNGNAGNGNAGNGTGGPGNDTLSGEGGLMMKRQNRRILSYAQNAYATAGKKKAGGLMMLKAIVPPTQPEIGCAQDLDLQRPPQGILNADGGFLVIGEQSDASIKLTIKKPR